MTSLGEWWGCWWYNVVAVVVPWVVQYTLQLASPLDEICNRRVSKFNRASTTIAPDLKVVHNRVQMSIPFSGPKRMVSSNIIEEWVCKASTHSRPECPSATIKHNQGSTRRHCGCMSSFLQICSMWVVMPWMWIGCSAGADPCPCRKDCRVVVGGGGKTGTLSACNSGGEGRGFDVGVWCSQSKSSLVVALVVVVVVFLARPRMLVGCCC